MKEKLYKNRDWLYEHYAIREESTYAMAKMADCSHVTIGYWLHRLDIPVRTQGEGTAITTSKRFRIYKDRTWLYYHYVELEESMYVMAKMAGCGFATILYWLHRFDIPARASGEGVFLATRNYLDIAPELLDLLEGELLGDGYIGMHGSRSALYAHSSKYESYLVWLSETLADLGIEQAGKINYRKPTALSPNGSHHYTSRSYPELVPIRQRWYPNGKKIVPQDLILTPIIARQWYIGDGGLGSSTNARSDINFSTCDFNKESIDHLLKELRGNGFKVTHRPSGNTIGLSVYSVKDFLDYIGPCPIDCYSYKWNYQDNRRA